MALQRKRKTWSTLNLFPLERASARYTQSACFCWQSCPSVGSCRCSRCSKWRCTFGPITKIKRWRTPTFTSVPRSMRYRLNSAGSVRTRHAWIALGKCNRRGYINFYSSVTIWNALSREKFCRCHRSTVKRWSQSFLPPRDTKDCN